VRLLLIAFLLVLQGSQTGIISGRILLPDGKPAAKVRVAARAIPEGADARNTGEMASIGQTDETGRFRLEGVFPGRYHITAGLGYLRDLLECYCRRGVPVRIVTEDGQPFSGAVRILARPLNPQQLRWGGTAPSPVAPGG
jgi:hypothetical protein